jgi:hypothetical protein
MALALENLAIICIPITARLGHVVLQLFKASEFRSCSIRPQALAGFRWCRDMCPQRAAEALSPDHRNVCVINCQKSVIGSRHSSLYEPERGLCPNKDREGDGAMDL